MQQVEVLAFVFVDAFGLHVEHRVRIDDLAGTLANQLGQSDLGVTLLFLPALLELGVGRHLFHLGEFAQVGHPVATDVFADQLGEPRVAQQHESPGGHPIGDIGETVGPEPVKFLQHVLFQQFGVQLGHAVHLIAADEGQMRHADLLDRTLFDQ